MTAPEIPDPPDIEARLSLLYEETGRVAAAFWDWRHKVILIASTAIALVFAITSWMYKERLGGIAMATPLLVGSAVAWMCMQFDRRNGQILDATYNAAEALERLLTNTTSDRQADLAKAGAYTNLRASREWGKNYVLKVGNYGHILRLAYRTLSAVFLALAVASLALGAASPDVLIPAR